MIDFNIIVSMPVLTVREGEDVGKISKAIIDAKEGKLAGFVLEDKNKQEKILPIEKVDVFGKDAIMVPSSNVLKAINEMPEMTEAIELGSKLIGMRIVTKTGEDAGKVASFHFDAEDGRITHYEASGGVFQDMVHGKGLMSKDGVVSLGRDALIVEEVAPTLSQSMKAGPGLKQIAQKATATTGKKIKQTAEKIKRTTGGLNKKPHTGSK